MFLVIERLFKFLLSKDQLLQFQWRVFSLTGIAGNVLSRLTWKVFNLKSWRGIQLFRDWKWILVDFCCFGVILVHLRVFFELQTKQILSQQPWLAGLKHNISQSLHTVLGVLKGGADELDFPLLMEGNGDCRGDLWKKGPGAAPCQAELVPVDSKIDPQLPKAQPISQAGGTTVKTLKKW